MADTAPGRHAGVLLHPTSLPGPGDAGVLGADAFRFVELLAAAGFRWWQMLPVGPVGDTLSPYQAVSAFAGNPRLIDPGFLGDMGWLTPGEVRGLYTWEDRRAALDAAFERFAREASPTQRAALVRFWELQRSWLLPYVLFLEARARHGAEGWWHWPAAIRDREPAAISALAAGAQTLLQRLCFEQFLFQAQWDRLRAYAQERGVRLLGDIPIYVDRDSADSWWHRALFRFDAAGIPDGVAGVPPDYFSADGQVWGNPLYDWPRMQKDGFRWWVDRIRHQLRRFQLLRLDHFRGLEAYWSVPTDAPTARNGSWHEAPGGALLTALREQLGSLPFVAEDLGTITPAVVELRERFGLPGMLILEFAFDGSDSNPYLPANHAEQAVVYTGTHDNDTLVGWYASLGPDTRDYVARALNVAPDALPDAVLSAVLESRARLAIVPFQDLLGLGTEARMNTPGTVTGNWGWRFSWEQVPAAAADRWRGQLAAAGRIEGEAGLPDSGA